VDMNHKDGPVSQRKLVPVLQPYIINVGDRDNIFIMNAHINKY